MSEIAPKRHCCKCGSQNITLNYNEEADALDCKCEECGYKWQTTTHEQNEKELARQIAAKNLTAAEAGHAVAERM